MYTCVSEHIYATENVGESEDNARCQFPPSALCEAGSLICWSPRKRCQTSRESPHSSAHLTIGVLGLHEDSHSGLHVCVPRALPIKTFLQDHIRLPTKTVVSLFGIKLGNFLPRLNENSNPVWSIP